MDGKDSVDVIVAHDTLAALDQAVQILERAWLPGKAGWDTDLFYGYVPYPPALFLSGLRELGPADGRRFLDVGCGIGTALLLARLSGWSKLTGLERDAGLAAVALQLTEWDSCTSRMQPGANIVVAHAHDYMGYDEHDVLYSYRLCVEDADQARLEQMIVRRARPGATVWFPGSRASGYGEQVGTDMWRIV